MSVLWSNTKMILRDITEKREFITGYFAHIKRMVKCWNCNPNKIGCAINILILEDYSIRTGHMQQ